MSGQTYKQCTLSKPVDGGTSYMVTWIRSELAKVGQVLDNLEDPESGSITSGWRVDTATEPPMPEQLIIKQSHSSHKFKRMTDI